MTANMENLSILALAESVLEGTKEITKYLQANNIAAPTFSSTTSTSPNTPEYFELQSKLTASLEDLQRLVEGPTKFYRSFFMLGYDLAAFQIALDFNFFGLVPAEGEISLEELAIKASLDEDRTSRVIRLLITQRFFREQRPGYVSHNSFSIALRDDELRSRQIPSFDEMVKAAYLELTRIGSSPVESNVNELVNNFHWGQLQGTVVDIGGGSGHVAMLHPFTT